MILKREMQMANNLKGIVLMLPTQQRYKLKIRKHYFCLS